MQQGFFRASGMVIHDHHASKKTEHPFKLLSFPVGGSLQRAEVGHFRKAPKLWMHYYDTRAHTPDANVGRTIALNTHGISDYVNQSEDSRLQTLMVASAGSFLLA